MATTMQPPITATAARDIWYAGNRMKIHVDGSDTRGQFSMIETHLKPGSEPPMHIHEYEDETFLVLEGTVKLTVGGEEFVLRAGEAKFAPRQVPHTFQVLSASARTINVVTPAGFEGFFRVLGQAVVPGRQADSRQDPSFDRIAEVATQFGVRLPR